MNILYEFRPTAEICQALLRLGHLQGVNRLNLGEDSLAMRGLLRRAFYPRVARVQLNSM